MSNTGLFTPSDINELMQYQQWPQFGQLEHIQTVQGSAMTYVDITDIKQLDYDIHMLTYFVDKTNDSGGSDYPGFQLGELSDGTSTIVTSTVYRYAAEWFSVDGGGNEAKSTGMSTMSIGIGSSHTMKFGGLTYFYDLGNPSKYTFYSGLLATAETSGTVFNAFYSGVLPQTSEVDTIRFNGVSTITSATFRLYGIRFT